MMRVALATMVAASLGLAGCRQELVCPGDQLACGGTCVAVATDPKNCGACGARCGPLGVCTSGSCQCGPETTLCGGSCVDLLSDPLNCGACGAACPGVLFCTSTGGVATCATACAAGQTSCHRACVDLLSSRYHCGACGRACGTGEHCSQGLCLADLYVACFNTNEVREATSDLAPAGIPIATEAGPLSLAWLGDSLFVANSLNNTVDELRFDQPAVRRLPPITIPTGGTHGPDLEFIAANSVDGLLYASDAGANSLVVFDRTQVIDQIPLGEPNQVLNPQGITFAGGKVYVALNGGYGTLADLINVAQEVAVLTPNAGCAPTPCWTITARVKLAALADTDHLPRPYRLATVGTRVFVTLENLKDDYSTTGNGKLAVIDVKTDALDGRYPLIDLGPSCQSAAAIVYDDDWNLLYVTCNASGAVIPVDLSSDPPVAKEAIDSGVHPGSIAICGGMLFVGDQWSGTVVRLNPAAPKEKVSARICPNGPGGFSLAADVACGR